MSNLVSKKIYDFICSYFDDSTIENIADKIAMMYFDDVEYVKTVKVMKGNKKKVGQIIKLKDNFENEIVKEDKEYKRVDKETNLIRSDTVIKIKNENEPKFKLEDQYFVYIYLIFFGLTFIISYYSMLKLQ